MSTVPHAIIVSSPPTDHAPQSSVSAGWYLSVKAAGEFAFSFFLMIATAPLSLLAMLLVRLTSSGPALYSQTRVGRGGKPFTIWKIRTMKHQCESHSGAAWSKPGDSRITPVGRWLRKTHIDELPQLWNVLRGDMSLVGPRPERPEFVPTLEKAIPSYRERLQVKPGITGFAQVQLPPDTDLNSVRLKLAYDLYYVQQVNCWLDLRIHFATALKMIGVPFRLIRAACAFPEQEHIEQAYRIKAQLFEAAAPAEKQVAGYTENRACAVGF